MEVVRSQIGGELFYKSENKMDELINYEDFIKGYKEGKFNILIRKSTTHYFVLSKQVEKPMRYAYRFYDVLGNISLIILPIILFLKGYGIVSLTPCIGGLFTKYANDKSAADFIRETMLKNEEFWNLILQNNGAKIIDFNNKQIKPKFSNFFDKNE